MKKNEYCIVDATPLINFALADSLPLLTKAANYFHFKMIDAVALEACFPGKPGAEKIADWIEKMKKGGKLDIIETETGRTLKAGRLKDSEFKLKDAGEHAIYEWIESGAVDNANQTIVVYEDKRLRKLLMNVSCDANIIIAAPRGFLKIGEEYGFVDNANDSWQKIIINAPTCNSVDEIFQVSRKVPKYDL